MVLLSLFVMGPATMVLNRGNHEDHIMNLRYGFIKELMTKYKVRTSSESAIFTGDGHSNGETHRGHVLVVACRHGDRQGDLRRPRRHLGQDRREHFGKDSSEQGSRDFFHHSSQYVSVLRPPVSLGDKKVNVDEWKQMLDVLWSDPKQHKVNLFSPEEVSRVAGRMSSEVAVLISAPTSPPLSSRSRSSLIGGDFSL